MPFGLRSLGTIHHASLNPSARPETGLAGKWGSSLRGSWPQSLRKPDNVVWPGLKPRTFRIISERWSEPHGPNPPALRDPTLAEAGGEEAFVHPNRRANDDQMWFTSNKSRNVPTVAARSFSLGVSTCPSMWTPPKRRWSRFSLR